MQAILLLLTFCIMVTVAEARQKRIVIEEFGFSSQPDLAALYDVQDIHAFNRTTFGASGWTDTDELPESSTWYDTAAAGVLANGWCDGSLTYFDHEVWRVEAADAQSVRLATAHKWAVMGNELKARLPNCTLSFYGYLGSNGVKSDYTRATSSNPVTYADWVRMNTDLAEIYSSSWDFLMPTFYISSTRDADGYAAMQDFHTYFHNTILEYRRMLSTYGHGQWLMPFIWHRKRDDSAYLDMDVWKDMICTAYLEGDGVSWFTISGTAWSDTAEYWIHMKNVLEDPNPCGNFESTRSAATTRSPATPRSLAITRTNR